jgi:hypothetical protein
MYIGLMQPERYSNSLGYLEFLHRVSNGKLHKDPCPPLAEFIDLAREHLDKVSLLCITVIVFVFHHILLLLTREYSS